MAKSDLLAAKIVLQNRLEYDQISKEILTIQSRPELLKYFLLLFCLKQIINTILTDYSFRDIQNVEQEISNLVNEIEVVDSRTSQRYTECSQVLENVQGLLENVNFDCKEFKQQ